MKIHIITSSEIVNKENKHLHLKYVLMYIIEAAHKFAYFKAFLY